MVLVEKAHILELGTVLSSNLPLWLFLNLYRLITLDLIIKLNVLKDHLAEKKD